MSGQCSRTVASNSEKFEGMPECARSACQAAGVPSAINMFRTGPSLIWETKPTEQRVIAGIPL